MTTINAVDTTLSGQSGTGSFAGTISPVFVTPTLGAAGATSVAFTPTTSGIIGTTTNDNASAGKVGEYINSVILQASSVSLSNGISKDLTSISLSSGDWNIWANGTFIASGSVISGALIWINTVSATLPDSAFVASMTTAGTFGSIGLLAPQIRLSINSLTTVFISAQASFLSGTVSLCGSISARRIR